MKRWRGIGALALAGALALGAFSPAMAHGGYGRPDRWESRPADGGFGGLHGLGPRILEDLNLTTEQRARVRELFRETFRSREENRNDTLWDHLRDFRRGRPMDPAVRKDLESEMAKRITDGTRALAKLHAILEPEQRSILQSKLDRFGTFGQGRREWPGFSTGRFSERLDLTEAQKARAEVLFKSWEKPMEARREQMQRLGSEMAKRAFSPNPDTRRLEADAKKLAGLAVDGIFDRSRHMEQFRSMLTDEQKRILDEGHMMRRPGKRVW